MVTVDATITLIDIMSDGSRQVLLRDYPVHGGEWHTLRGQVTPPKGKEVVRLEAIPEGGSEKVVAECEFYIE